MLLVTVVMVVVMVMVMVMVRVMVMVMVMVMQLPWLWLAGWLIGWVAGGWWWKQVEVEEKGEGRDYLKLVQESVSLDSQVESEGKIITTSIKH